MILEHGKKRIAVEFKSSKAPTVTRGFWNAIEDLKIKEAWIIAPIEGMYPIKAGVNVSGLANFVQRINDA